MKERKPPWTPLERVGSGPVGDTLYINARYQVALRPSGVFEPFGEITEMSIKRRDRKPLFDWRDIQKIKNDLFGTEATAIQVFPPESRLVDTSNQYYFFVFTDYRLPFGFKFRGVSGQSGISIMPGEENKQRPFDPEHKPKDLEEDEKKYMATIQEFKRIFWND